MSSSGTIDPSHFDPPKDAEEFYREALRLMVEWEIPFLLGGTYALTCYTGIRRPTKDMDVFCKAGDAPRLLSRFQDAGYRISVEDERWIGKVWQDDLFFDVIYSFSSANLPVRDSWFEEEYTADVYGVDVRIVSPTEFIISKLLLQDRYRYDAADIAHVMLKKHEEVDWQRLLSAMELYWEVLLIQLLNFRFVYPSERDCIPQWLMDELLERVQMQSKLPPTKMRVCRGRLFSPRDYLVDITDWGFADVVGKGLEEPHEREEH
ncbi:nucleotidyltransferase family protein [Altericroceibacterium xinjiangense]|uniref:nucleotidyltransferase family protein n=1 Tax=Altericroceibacterium xinjiangense TaxID=762261 RepID=UPI000F7EAAEE|nr:nucleotidyltransferase family protein [Altericroceibacterium xinjiangense]